MSKLFMKTQTNLCEKIEEGISNRAGSFISIQQHCEEERKTLDVQPIATLIDNANNTMKCIARVTKAATNVIDKASNVLDVVSNVIDCIPQQDDKVVINIHISKNKEDIDKAIKILKNL